MIFKCVIINSPWHRQSPARCHWHRESPARCHLQCTSGHVSKKWYSVRTGPAISVTMPRAALCLVLERHHRLTARDLHFFLFFSAGRTTHAALHRRNCASSSAPIQQFVPPSLDLIPNVCTSCSVLYNPLTDGLPLLLAPCDLLDIICLIKKNCNRFDLLSYHEIDVITSNACTVLSITHVIAVREVTPSRYVMCTTPQL